VLFGSKLTWLSDADEFGPIVNCTGISCGIIAPIAVGISSTDLNFGKSEVVSLLLMDTNLFKFSTGVYSELGINSLSTFLRYSSWFMDFSSSLIISSYPDFDLLSLFSLLSETFYFLNISCVLRKNDSGSSLSECSVSVFDFFKRGIFSIRFVIETCSSDFSDTGDICLFKSGEPFL
jgi:hypothetical protein